MSLWDGCLDLTGWFWSWLGSLISLRADQLLSEAHTSWGDLAFLQAVHASLQQADPGTFSWQMCVNKEDTQCFSHLFAVTLHTSPGPEEVTAL